MTADVVPVSPPSTALAVSDEFRNRYPGLAMGDDPEMRELLDNTFEDGRPRMADLDMVTFPTGGATSWTRTVGGEDTLAKSITGIVVGIFPQRTFWTSTVPTGDLPECMSRDGKVPVYGGLFSPDGDRGAENPEGTCATCPMSQWGSSPKEGSRAQHCVEQRLVFVMEPGALLPTVIRVSPASRRILARHFQGLVASKRLGHWQMVTEFTLVKATNKAGQEYAELAPKRVSDLISAEIALARECRDTVKKWVAAEPPITFADRSETGAVDVEDYVP